jgi:hypothetical protein
MPASHEEIFGWIEQTDGQNRQTKIEIIRLEIGKALLTRYQELKQTTAIAEEALTSLGLKNILTPSVQTETYIDIHQYHTIRQDLEGHKGSWSRLWNGLWRQHNHQQKWSALFDEEGRLNVNTLSTAVNRQEFGYKLGSGSRHLAKLLVDHLLSDQDTNI